MEPFEFELESLLLLRCMCRVVVAVALARGENKQEKEIAYHQLCIQWNISERIIKQNLIVHSGENEGVENLRLRGCILGKGNRNRSANENE